jgi:hypothetical protein
MIFDQYIKYAFSSHTKTIFKFLTLGVESTPAAVRECDLGSTQTKFDPKLKSCKPKSKKYNPHFIWVRNI